MQFHKATLALLSPAALHCKACRVTTRLVPAREALSVRQNGTPKAVSSQRHANPRRMKRYSSNILGLQRDIRATGTNMCLILKRGYNHG